MIHRLKDSSCLNNASFSGVIIKTNVNTLRKLFGKESYTNNVGYSQHIWNLCWSKENCLNYKGEQLKIPFSIYDYHELYRFTNTEEISFHIKSNGYLIDEAIKEITSLINQKGKTLKFVHNDKVSFHVVNGGGDYKENSEDEYFDGIVFDIVLDNNVKIGNVCISKNYEEIKALYIIPKYRRIGFGKDVVKQLLQQYPTIYYVYSIQESNGFWGKQGFKIDSYNKDSGLFFMLKID